MTTGRDPTFTHDELPPKTSSAHHFVPRFYLRRFADPSGRRILRHERWSGAEKVISVADACVITDLNTAEEMRGPYPPDEFESAMTFLDNQAAPMFADLVQGRIPSVGSQERADLAYYIVWLWFRSPHHREYVDLVTTRALRAEIAKAPGDAGNVLHRWLDRAPTADEVEAARRGDMTLEWRRGAQMKMATKFARISPFLLQYTWVVASAHDLPTSDAPTIFLGEGEESLLGLEDVGFIALSPTRLLLFIDVPDPTVSVELSEEQIQRVRLEVWSRAIDYTFRPPGAVGVDVPSRQAKSTGVSSS